MIRTGFMSWRVDFRNWLGRHRLGLVRNLAPPIYAFALVAFRRTRSDNDDNRFPSAELDLRPRSSRYRLTTLQDAQAYIIIGIVAIVGTFLVRAIWWTP